MTPIALISWSAHLHYLPVQETWAFWVASPITVGVFTALALGEYIGDKLPKTPSRTSPFPFFVRICFGGLVGAVVATELKSSDLQGIIPGVIGAAIGTFGGYSIRHHLTSVSGWLDLRMALIEDCVAFALSFVAVGIATR